LLRGVLIVACLVGCLVAASPASAGRPLRTAIVDPGAFSGPDQAQAFARTVQTGATYVRLSLGWSSVAPTAPTVPTDPDDLAYAWTEFDRQVDAALAAGLTPIVCIEWAPGWAGGISPDATAFGQFAEAAAKRYAGPPGAHPRIRYWEAWNEPNRDYFLMPQYANGKIVSHVRYRAMVNKFAAAVHAVNATNRVIAGGLAPLGRSGKPAPLAFMRKLLSSPTSFDIWSHHPYTSGGPLHLPPGGGDIVLGNLDKMRALLKAKAGKIRSTVPVEFWVTEFSWDSKPPDPQALGQPLHKRWVAEALYRMWADGVSLVTWFRIKDDPLASSPYQSGFFTTSGNRKPSLQAFRFPLVALRKPSGILVWGRTPLSTKTKVVIQVKTGAAWKRLSTLQSNAAGIFQKTYKVPYRKGHIRAKASGETSVAFSLKYVPDRFVNPFGCGGYIAC
jgi:Cellulase (glycosyl hydrolase family 5)